MKITINSEYGKGTEISLIIFLNKNESNLNYSISQKSVLSNSDSNERNFDVSISNNTLNQDMPSNENKSNSNYLAVVKVDNNQLNTSVLINHFQGVENNNSEILIKKELDNSNNINKTDRNFSYLPLDQLINEGKYQIFHSLTEKKNFQYFL